MYKYIISRDIVYVSQAIHSHINSNTAIVTTGIAGMATRASVHGGLSYSYSKQHPHTGTMCVQYAYDHLFTAAVLEHMHGTRARLEATAAFYRGGTGVHHFQQLLNVCLQKRFDSSRI